MFCIKLVCVAVVCASARAHTTGCSEDAHCSSGFFCAVSQRQCRPCLRCEELRRGPPLRATDCVTAAAECATCFTGFVEDNSSRSGACVPPGAADDAGAAPPYGMIAAIVVLQLLALAVCCAAVHALRHFKAYRMFTSTLMTSMRSARPQSEPPATPLPPPPYNTVALLPAVDSGTIDEESSAPFIKAVRARNDREAAGSQAAQVFRNPVYMNGENLPPSYETAARNELSEAAPSVQNDHTMDRANNNILIPNSDAEQTIPLGTAEQLLMNAPDTNILRVRQDSNNDSGEGGEGRAGCHPSFLAHQSCPFVINVIKNVTTVQQHNDLAS